MLLNKIDQIIFAMCLKKFFSNYFSRNKIVNFFFQVNRLESFKIYLSQVTLVQVNRIESFEIYLSQVTLDKVLIRDFMIL